VQMIDLPPGEWSALLVGLQWVDGTAVGILDDAVVNRNTVVSQFADLYRTLQGAINSTLAQQEGVTADAIRDAFRQGSEQALEVARKNQAYADAYQKAVNAVVTLRAALTDIAARGNKEISDIQNSKADVGTKVAEITDAIGKYQREANQKAGACADDIKDAGEGVVTAQGGNGPSFRSMAHNAGFDGNQQPDLKAIEDQVRGKLDPTAPPASAAGTPQGATPPGAPPASAAATPQAATPPAPAPPPPAPAPPASVAATPQAATPPAPAPPAPAPAPPGSVAAMPQAATPQAPGPAAAPAGLNIAGGGPGFGPPPSMGAPPAMGNMPMTPISGMGAPGGLPTGAPPGMTPGAPLSAPAAGGGPPGLPGGPVQAMQPQVPPTAPTFPTAATGTQVTAGDAPAPPPAAASSAPTPTAYTSEPASTMMAGPAAVAPVSPAPAGPLPAYGADLVRPTVAAPPSSPIIPSATSAPSAPISAPPSTVPGSAPVHPSAGGATGIGQPAAVARQTGLPTAAQAPPGVGTESAIASAGGALAGAVSAEATARARLQRLVAAVAGQQPRLSWAVGDRADDTTVLVTDLASGWIPPGIEIPSALTLLEPARRRGDLEALLGEVRLAAATEADHYRPESETDEPVPMSPRRRLVPEVEDLGWELNRATLYRDGLTRLAHTLATAASKNTGVLESEAEELHSQLTALADRVLDSYPDHVNAADVGNWQLLAAIEALVNEDRIAANYHLAWFLACNTAAAESLVQ
jgi:Family of unknown function (DUF5632)/Family of unknown function (DUF5631)